MATVHFFFFLNLIFSKISKTKIFRIRHYILKLILHRYVECKVFYDAANQDIILALI